MQHTCAKCKEPFETVHKKQYYCRDCRNAYNRAYGKAHPERRRNWQRIWYGHRQPEKKTVVMQVAKNIPKHMLFCPACWRDTHHVKYSTLRREASKWQCQSCTRIRALSAPELREMRTEVP